MIGRVGGELEGSQTLSYMVEPSTLENMLVSVMERTKQAPERHTRKSGNLARQRSFSATVGLSERARHTVKKENFPPIT